MLTLIPRVVGVLLCSAFIVLGASSSALAQSAGTVRGVVTDVGDATVPGANVTLENSLTGYRREATTDADGRFTFFNVPFGS